jgi:hypothetical protein
LELHVHEPADATMAHCSGAAQLSVSFAVHAPEAVHEYTGGDAGGFGSTPASGRTSVGGGGASSSSSGGGG